MQTSENETMIRGDHDDNRCAVAALAVIVGELYQLASGPDGYVASVAAKSEDACVTLRRLVEGGAGNSYQAGCVLGLDIPTGRGAIIPRGQPAPAVCASVRSGLSAVPVLLHAAWASLLQYYEQPDCPWMHLEEAVWRMADANLLLKLASERADLCRVLVTIDHPTLPFVASDAWKQRNREAWLRGTAACARH